jgi:hypothetical protein
MSTKVVKVDKHRNNTDENGFIASYNMVEFANLGVLILVAIHYLPT